MLKISSIPANLAIREESESRPPNYVNREVIDGKVRWVIVEEKFYTTRRANGMWRGKWYFTGRGFDIATHKPTGGWWSPSRAQLEKALAGKGRGGQ